MIPTMLQREPNGGWGLPNANLLVPFKETLKTCSQKCDAIAALLPRVDARDANVWNFRVNLAVLAGKVRSLTYWVAHDRELDSIDDLKREKLRARIVQIAVGLTELKDKYAYSSPFKLEDFSDANALIEEFGKVLGEVPVELAPIPRKECTETLEKFDIESRKEVVKWLNADLERSLGWLQLLQYSDESGLTLPSDDLRRILTENPEAITEMSKLLFPLLQSDSLAMRDVATDVLIKIYPEWERLEEALFPLLKISDRDLVIRVARILQDGRLVVRNELAEFLKCILPNSSGAINVARSMSYRIIHAPSIDLRDLKVIASLLENPDERISAVACFIMVQTTDYMRITQASEMEFSGSLMQLLSSDLAHVRRNAITCLYVRRWRSVHPGLNRAIITLRDDPDLAVRHLAMMRFRFS